MFREFVSTNKFGPDGQKKGKTMNNVGSNQSFSQQLEMDYLGYC